MTLAWSDPADASITEYEYAVQPAGNDPGGWTSIPSSDAATTSYIATGLTNDTAYTMHLRAVNAGGGAAAALATATPEISGIVVQDSSGNALTALSIPEGGEVAYQVKLSSRPKTDVTMDVNLADRIHKDPDITFKGQASNVFSMPLTFTLASWNTAQTVTLVAAEDDDAANGARDVLHAARAYAAAHVEIVATEIDNDPSIVLQDSSGNPISGLSIAEGGEVAYQVKLSSRPNADVTMNVNLLDRTNDDTDVTFKGQAGNIELTFTPENWNTAQTVTLAAAEDADAENGARNVDHSARMYTSAKATLPVTEIDNDEAGIIVQDASGNAVTALAVPEGGEASYQVMLASRPAQDVEVCIGLSVQPNNDSDITFKGQASDVVALKLTFTAENWNTAQTVTLVAAEDNDDVNGARAVVNDAREYFPGEVALTATEVDNDQLTVTVARGNDGDTASVSWTAYAGDDFQYYRVIVCTAAQYDGSSCSGTVFRSGAIHDADATGPVTATGLSAGTGYGIILQVWRNGSALKRHATLPALDVPAAPANVAVEPGTGYLDISWDAVSDATGYDVRAKKAGAADWHAVVRNVTGTSYRYTTTETMDYVAVRARNANGVGNWTELSRMPASDWLTTVQQTGGASAQSASMASGQAQNQLAAPAWGTITRDNGRKHILYLNWTAVTGASGYNVICSHNDGWSWWQCGSIASQSTTTLTVNNGPNGTDLSRERSYKVAVRAVNSNSSQASNWTNSENIRPVFRWLHDLTYTRADGQITLRWAPNFWTTGYQIDCAVAESGKVATYTRCATLTGQDDNAAQHSVTIPHSTNSTYTIDDTKTYDIRITSTNEWDTGGNAQMFAPLVYPSGLTASNVAQNAATITLAHATHTGDWHYQADKGSDATCQGPVSGTKTDVVGLAGGETYRYKAYSDRGCSTGSRLGTSAEFTTATLTVSNLTQDGATLTIAGDHASTWYYKRSGEASCLGPVSLASVNLTNLTASTIYTYVSYSDSTCTPANLIATTSAFTTNGVSVSNLSQSVHTEHCTVYSSSKCALGFTTGSNSTGYTLDVITAEFLSVIGDPGDLVVTLHADNSGVPADTSLATLSGSNPVANTRSGNYAYTCSGAGCTLSANTTYFVQFSATKGTDSRNSYGLATTLSDQQTLVPASNGWSLADKMDYKTTGNWGEFDDVPKLTLVATTNAGGAGTAQTASAVVATATVRGTDSPLNPAGAAAQAANRAGNAANAHKGSGRGETAAVSATRSPGHVTNLASARSGDSDVDATQRQAVAFTTGSSPGGYTLKRFTAALRKVGGNADLVLTLHAMASTTYGDDSQPAPTVLATLAGSAPASGAYTDATYACSGEGCVLAPDTTYFVVAESSGNGAYAWAYVASANLYTETTVPSDSGWTLGASHYAQDGEAWASFGDWHHARVDFETHPVLSVGNLDEAPHPDACFPSGDATCAVGFTTGSAPDGCTLRALTARFEAADDPDGMLGALVVALHADNAGLPGRALATLSGDNPTQAGDYTYTCSGAGCALKPDTTYFVQVSATAGEYLSEAYAWSATLSDHETQSPAGNGWTLANGTTAYRSTWQAYPDVGLLAIFATP